MKTLLIIIMLVLVAGCTTTVDVYDEELSPPENIPINEPPITDNNEVPIIPPTIPTEPVPQPPSSFVSVVDGGFESDEENFVALENPLKVGFQYSKYYLGAYEGKGTMRVIVSQAKKEAYEIPAFRVSLDGSVLTGKNYEVSMYFDDLKGSWAPMKIGFGENKFPPSSVERTEGEYTKVIFDVVSDVNSEYLYLYFDGTTTKSFKIDLISISEN